MKQFFIFVAGAALGSLATFVIAKNHYEQIIQEEIDNTTKERLSRRKTEIEDIDDEPVVDEKDVEEYENIIDSAGYKKYSDISKPASEKAAVAKIDRPYVIRPEEFGELDNYERISLTHYSDGVLTDDSDEKMADDEIDEVVGADYADHFGEYEDDSVFVRNDKLKCDYEILMDLRKYSDLPNITRYEGTSY